MPLHERATTVFTVSLIMLIIATVFTALRVLSKWVVLKRTSADDWLMLAAWIFTVGLTVSVMVGAHYGLGRTDANILPEWAGPLKQCIYAFTIFYNPALMCIKSAILIIYSRLASAHRFLRIASYVLLGLVNVAGIVLTFLNIFQCRPISAALGHGGGECIDIVSLYLSSAPIAFLTDVAILLLPLPILTGLRMEFRQKVVLVATFFVGGFSTIVDIVRLVYLQNTLKYERLYEASSVITAKDTPPNFVYEASFTLMWSCVEVTTGLVCACVLVLKPLVLRVLPAMIHHQSSSAEKTAPAYGGETGSAVPRSPTSRLAPVFEISMLEEGDDDDGGSGMDFMQMLTANEVPMTSPPAANGQSGYRNGAALGATTTTKTSRLGRLTKSNLFAHTQTNLNVATQQQPHQNFFDFVHMSDSKSLTALTEREAWWPVLFVSTLFFVWGFAYGLLGTLNGHIHTLLNYSTSRILALQAAYWLGYLLGPACIGYWTLTRSSFKSTFIAGLCLYACGAMAFWPSSVLLSYAGFFISNFIITLGLSCLEMAAGPFIALAGPQYLSESRLLFAQGIQAIGSVISPIIAREALFASLDGGAGGGADLFNVQWCYLAVALLVVILAVIFYYVPLPESKDDELEDMAQTVLLSTGLDPDASFPVLFGGRVAARSVLMWMGVYGIFVYVGAQETFAFFFGSTIGVIRPQVDSFWMTIIGHSIFAISRFLAAGVTYIGYLTPRIVLLISVIGAFITSLLALVLPPGRGTLAVHLLTFFFEAPIFPVLYGIALRNQGRRTKMTATLMITGIAGGTVFPPIGYGTQLDHPTNGRITLIVTAVTWAAQLVVPIWLCGGMRVWVDPVLPPNHEHSPALRGVSGAFDWYKSEHMPEELRADEVVPEDRRGSDETPATSVTAVTEGSQMKSNKVVSHEM